MEMKQYGIWAAVVFMIAAAVFILYRLWRRRHRVLTIDEMEGLEFEKYCADVLQYNGFHHVRVTNASGDYGADILAERDGITYAVQCKCYDHPVGISAVQEIYAGRDYYDCMVGVVMTNQYFTGPAINMAEKLNIMLWDREDVDRMQRER